MPDSLFYAIVDGRAVKIGEDQFLAQGASVCYLTQEQFKAYHQRLGLEETIYNDLNTERANFRTSLDAYDDASVGYLNIINVDDLDGEMDRVMFIIRHDLLCFVKIDDGDGSESGMFQAIMAQEKQNTSPARVFYRFLERLLKGGNGKLETIEDELLALEDEVVHGRAGQGLSKIIYSYRRQLSMIRNYYEQLVDISEELEENENEIYSEHDLSYFRVLTARATRLIAGVRALSETLNQLREMLDAALNYTLNNTMKLFTIISAIFLPLTLIVGWYGMNFKHMPELEWRYAYPALIVFCIVVIGFILFYFKRKKLM